MTSFRGSPLEKACQKAYEGSGGLITSTRITKNPRCTDILRNNAMLWHKGLFSHSAVPRRDLCRWFQRHTIGKNGNYEYLEMGSLVAGPASDKSPSGQVAISGSEILAFVL